MIFAQTWRQVLDGTATITSRPIRQHQFVTWTGYRPADNAVKQEPDLHAVWVPRLGQKGHEGRKPIHATGELVRAAWVILERGNRLVYCTWSQHGGLPRITYAVQPGPGQEAVARVKITLVRKLDRRLISAEDARAEGFAGPVEFLRWWTRAHDPTAWRWGERAGWPWPSQGDTENRTLAALMARPDVLYWAWVLYIERV